MSPAAPGSAPAPAPGSAPPAPAAVQMWTLYDQAAADLPGTLHRVAALGYPAVEIYGLHGHTPDAVRAHCAAAGLTVCSAHLPFPAGPGADAVLDTAQALGAPVLAWSLEADACTTPGGLAAGAARVNEAAARAADRGIRVAYHNHIAEFTRTADGRTGYDLLRDAFDPAVELELDVYWARAAGLDPAPLAASLGDRLTLVHLKDGPATALDDTMRPFGEGVVDIDGAARANPAVTWQIVEADRTDGDVWDLLRRCYRHLVGRGLATGRLPVDPAAPAAPEALPEDPAR